MQIKQCSTFYTKSTLIEYIVNNVFFFQEIKNRFPQKVHKRTCTVGNRVISSSWQRVRLEDNTKFISLHLIRSYKLGNN